MGTIDGGKARRQIRSGKFAGALAELTLDSMQSRAKAGWLPDLPEALGRIRGPQSGDGHPESSGTDRSPGPDGAADPAGPAGSLGSEVLALHLAALDIALQVDGRFNGLHHVLLRSVAAALATSGAPPHRREAEDGGPGNGADDIHGTGGMDGRGGRSSAAAAPSDDGDIQELLRQRLPSYLEWMRDFVAAQINPRVREPRQVLGLEDPADSAVVIVALSELVSLYHRIISGWDLVE